MDALDPNAYATGAQAASVNARAAFEENDVNLARERRDFAAQELLAAEKRFDELETAYKLGKKARDDAAKYAQLAARQLKASLARLAEVRAPLHPVRKIPLELLGMIFEYCWDPLPKGALLSEKPIDVRRRQRQPFQLAAVCRRWRRASLSCPIAWNCIELRLDAVPKVHSKYWAAYISCMLSRSAATPLHLRFIRNRSSEKWENKLIIPFVNEMHRCESLLLSAERVANDQDDLVALLTVPTPALRTLHLMLLSEDGSLELPNVLPHAPRLYRLRSSFHFAYEQTLLSAVTFFAFYGPVVSDGSDDIGNALSVCENVEDMSLVDPLVTPSDTIVAKVPCNASRLRIQFSSTSVDEIALADQFVFPRLSSLVVHGSNKGSAARVHLVHFLLPEAVPHLAYLTMGEMAECDIELFLEGLHPAGELAWLKLTRCAIGSHGLRHLCNAFGLVRDDGSWLCPELTDLDLRECTFLEDCALDDLVELVARRNRAAAETDQPQRSPPRWIAPSLRAYPRSSEATSCIGSAISHHRLEIRC